MRQIIYAAPSRMDDAPPPQFRGFGGWRIIPRGTPVSVRHFTGFQKKRLLSGGSSRNFTVVPIFFQESLKNRNRRCSRISWPHHSANTPVDAASALSRRFWRVFWDTRGLMLVAAPPGVSQERPIAARGGRRRSGMRAPRKLVGARELLYFFSLPAASLARARGQRVAVRPGKRNIRARCSRSGCFPFQFSGCTRAVPGSKCPFT